MNFNWVDHYHWFYSTLAQSLAAFLGIIGVFAIFRLQIQHNAVEETFSKLRDFILKNDPRGNDLKIVSMNNEKLMKHCNDLNNFWAEKCISHERQVRNWEKEIEKLQAENPGSVQILLSDNIGKFKEIILRDRKLIAGLMLHKTKYTNGYAERQLISGKAFYITKHLFILFVLSMLGLCFVNDLVSFNLLSNVSRFAALTMLVYLFSIGIELVKFFKRSLKGDFWEDAFRNVEKKTKWSIIIGKKIRGVFMEINNRDLNQRRIRYIAILLTVLSSFFLIRGIIFLSAENLAELSTSKWGYNLEIAKNLVRQRTDTVVGFCLLVLSFILQSIDFLWPLRLKTLPASKNGIIIAIVWISIISLGAFWCAHFLYERSFIQVQSILPKIK